jgi:hypothetical protein
MALLHKNADGLAALQRQRFVRPARPGSVLSQHHASPAPPEKPMAPVRFLSIPCFCALAWTQSSKSDRHCGKSVLRQR